MGYWKLLKLYPRTISLGFIQAFFSGMGQTHFISIFSPLIMAQFALSSTEYGSIYSAITLVSGILIMFLGPLIDRYDSRWIGVWIGLGLLVSQLLFLEMKSLSLVCLGLLGLRLFGQGLCSTLSSITIARYFDVQRGKALSLSQMGYPAYEGIITPLATILLGQYGFNNLIYLLIASLILILIPCNLLLTRGITEFNKPNPFAEKSAIDKEQPKGFENIHTGWNRKRVFSNKTVYLLIIHLLMPPFALTGLIFHQTKIAEIKQWPLEWMAYGFMFFAAGRTLNTFLTGPLVDRYRAISLFPFYQIPLTLGFVCLAYLQSAWASPLAFLLFGLSVGSGGPIKSAIWAELYGTQHLGAIKSLFATLMVLSTAASPGLFGWIIDTTGSSYQLLIALITVSFCGAFLAFVGLKLHQQ